MLVLSHFTDSFARCWCRLLIMLHVDLHSLHLTVSRLCHTQGEHKAFYVDRLMSKIMCAQVLCRCLYFHITTRNIIEVSIAAYIKVNFWAASWTHQGLILRCKQEDHKKWHGRMPLLHLIPSVKHAPASPTKNST